MIPMEGLIIILILTLLGVILFLIRIWFILEHFDSTFLGWIIKKRYYPNYKKSTKPPPKYTCLTCRKALRYVTKYKRWYCPTCKKYV